MNVFTPLVKPLIGYNILLTFSAIHSAGKISTILSRIVQAANASFDYATLDITSTIIS